MPYYQTSPQTSQYQPRRPLTREEFESNVAEQKEEAIARDIRRLEMQKQDIIRLKQLEKKRNEMKEELVKEYLK